MEGYFFATRLSSILGTWINNDLLIRNRPTPGPKMSAMVLPGAPPELGVDENPIHPSTSPAVRAKKGSKRLTKPTRQPQGSSHITRRKEWIDDRNQSSQPEHATCQDRCGLEPSGSPDPPRDRNCEYKKKQADHRLFIRQGET